MNFAPRFAGNLSPTKKKKRREEKKNFLPIKFCFPYPFIRLSFHRKFLIEGQISLVSFSHLRNHRVARDETLKLD